MTQELLELKQYVNRMYHDSDFVVTQAFYEKGKFKKELGAVLKGEVYQPEYTNFLTPKLRHLCSITDSEAIEVAKACFTPFPNGLELNVVRSGEHHNPPYIGVQYRKYEKGFDGKVNPNSLRSVIQFDLKNNSWYCNNSSYAHIATYQYLQQRDFALPIYFKGVQYSVDRLVELGIITLKS